ncbi:MAG TPA: RNA helicase, partial [Ramlibacter sp.]|nr:RNA helicase [Ramlibacter sp.]
EGFMEEIARFTKQNIPVKVIEGFAPEAGERAEPIAMGRQTIWGGAGKPPSREVMAAAAKAARREMMDRIRENKAEQGDRGAKKESRPAQQQAKPRNGNANGNRNGNRNANGNRTGNGQQQQRQQQAPRRDPQMADPHNMRDDPERDDRRDDRDDDRIPSNIDPLRTNLPSRRDMTGVKRVNGNGQPDPTRTSIDSMGAGKRSGGGGGNRNRGGNSGQRSRFGTR